MWRIDYKPSNSEKGNTTQAGAYTHAHEIKDILFNKR